MCAWDDSVRTSLFTSRVRFTHASLRARNTPPLSPTLVSKLPQEWSLLHRLLYELSAERRDVSCENTGAPLNPLRVYGLSHG